MSIEAAIEIQRLLDRTDEQARERNSRLELVRESCTLATEMLNKYGEKITKDTYTNDRNGMRQLIGITSNIKTRPISIVINDTKGEVYLQQSPNESLDEGKSTNRGPFWIYFEEAGLIPIQRPLKLLFHLDEHSASSPEGTLKTPAQFDGLKKVLGYIKTSLESSPSKK
ncbi:MAG: hypothetical protein U1E54_02040 [Candidatus Levybacteria bacterium]|nr:hypothetical protein [Candidatus Levybacteria bacterium]